MEGKIKWYSQEKGYGFVEGNDGGDYFVHHTQVPQDLHLDEGVSVEFEAAETDRGSQARNVRAPGAAPAPAKKADAKKAPVKEAEDDADVDEASEEPADDADVDEASEEPADDEDEDDN